MLEEAFANVALFEHGNIGHAGDLWGCHRGRQVQYALERRQFAVDAPIAGSLLLPLFDVSTDLVCRDFNCS